MSYIIASSAEEEPLRLDPDDLFKSMSLQWPETEVKSVEDDEQPYSYQWSLANEPRALIGYFFKDGIALNIDGLWSDCIQFALWVRSYVPEHQPLIFCDNLYNYHIELEQNTSTDDIERAFSE